MRVIMLTVSSVARAPSCCMIPMMDETISHPPAFSLFDPVCGISWMAASPEMLSAAHAASLDITQLKDTVLRQQRQIEELGAQLARSSAEKTDLLRRARVMQSTSRDYPICLPPRARTPAPEPAAAVGTIERNVRPVGRMRRWAERSSCAA